MAEATGGLVDPTIGVAMDRLGYDRDFSEVLLGVDGLLPDPRPRRDGVPSPSTPSDPSSGSGGHLHRPRCDGQALAADRAATAIHDRLGCGVLVSLGGDAAVAGPAPDGGFAIGIADSCTSRHAPEAVGILSGGLASSGTGVRQWRLGTHQVHHILDPATCLPSTPYWRTVSTTAATCVQANAASTAAMIMGAGRRLAPGHGIPARLVHVNGSVEYTSEWPAPEAGAGDARTERPVIATLVATVGHGSTALWYLTRATRLVSLILAFATVVLGTVASVGWTTDRWPRFLSQSVHRNLSLFCIALIGVHVVSTIGDGYVPIAPRRRGDPVPFPLPPDLGGPGSPGVRHAARRRHHQRAPAAGSAPAPGGASTGWPMPCWPIAVVHGLGSGSDARLPGATLVFVLLHRRRSPQRWPGVSRAGRGRLGELAAGQGGGRRRRLLG